MTPKIKVLGTATASATFDRYLTADQVFSLADNVKREALLKLLPFVRADIDVLNERITVTARLIDYSEAS